RRLGYPNESAHPFELEVGALLGLSQGHAMDKLQLAQAAVEAQVAIRATDPLRSSGRSPLAQLAAELGLSPLAADILLVVAAPLLRGELARLYAILANDPGRPMCDELLVTQILGSQAVSRHEIARALDPLQPLLRFGLVAAGSAKARPFAAL